MKIVCFHLNQIGDLAFSLPALRSIRDSRPDCKITSVVRPGSIEVMEATGLADKVVSRNSKLNLDKYRLINCLAGEKYDLAVVFSQSADCAALAYMSRVPRRVGFINTSLGFLLTKQVDFKHPPSTENNLRLIAEAGFHWTCENYVGLMKPTEAQIERADRILSEQGIKEGEAIVALSPGTSGRRSVKEWTDEGFAAVGRHLADRGIRVMVVGTQPADGIIAGCGSITDLSGCTNLGEALAILWRSKALIAVDSGILHMAAAAGTKVVGMYGPSNPDITGPQGEGHIVIRSGEVCSPCVKTECKFERKCMTNIHPQEVIAAVDAIINAKPEPCR